MTVSEFLKFLLSQKRQKGNRNSWGARQQASGENLEIFVRDSS